MATSTSDLTTATTPSRRRYVRSNTSSVTQILSDSCNSILQRFRRNPSEKLEKRSQYRFNDLAPSASSSAIYSSRDRHNSSTATSDYGSLGSSSDSVHRSPYLNFNSTMSSYYKPLFRTFGKRYDSPPKRDTEDKDKTPIVSASHTPAPSSSSANSASAAGGDAASSTISRLESKYSDILDRVHRRKDKDKDDKEKTLEPERTPTNFGGSRGFNALAKSATTSNVRDESYSSGLKERTPYRLATQRNRNKFLESLEMDYYKKRAELSLAYGGAGTSKAGCSSTADSLYDRNGRDPSNSKYVLKPRSKDSGYYDGKPLSVATSSTSISGKENIFKSKYDPDELLSELNSSSILSGAVSKSKRVTRPYKRSDTTALSFLQHSTTSGNGLNLSETALETAERKKENRRSGNFHQLQRSVTQGFFDADDICTAPISSDDDGAPSNDPKQIERDHRRKEIESILQKYAPLDDKKPRDKKSSMESSTTTVNPMASERSPEGGALTRIKSPMQPRLNHDRQHHQRSIRHHYRQGDSSLASGSGLGGGLQKSFTTSNVSSHLNGGSSNGLYNGNGSILTIHTGGASSSALIRQQQLHSQLLLRSSRSRIPKALSSFVRI